LHCGKRVKTSSVIFISVGGSEGKAEWIGDSQDPKYDDIKHIKDVSGEDLMIVSVQKTKT
jgi:hypothetical protein